MEAGKILINKIFNGSTLPTIPFYQRAYVWGEDQWERFIEDMEYVSDTDKPLFLGSIILKFGQRVSTSDNVPYSERKMVVDGQQRLTTLMLFMKALCLKTDQMKLFDKSFRLEDDSICFHHGRYDSEAFSLIMKTAQPTEIDNTSMKSNMIDAFNYFLENVDPDKVNRNKINSNLQFVCIDLGEDEDAQPIFDTINSLGVKLTTAELLKNYFYTKDNESDYVKNWEGIFEKDNDTREYWDQEFELGRLTRSMIDVFFSSYFQLFIQDSRYNISAADKDRYTRLEELFNSYQHFIKNYCNGDKNVVLSEMKEYAEIFAKTFDPAYCNTAMPSAHDIERMNVLIFGLKTSTLTPYILYVVKNVSDADKRAAIFRVLETYIMRRMIVSDSNKNYNNMFSSLILNKILDSDDLFSHLAQSPNPFPNDESLLEGFKHSKLINLQTKGILYFIESAIRDQKQATALLGFNDYSLEHLMPKKWVNNRNQGLT